MLASCKLVYQKSNHPLSILSQKAIVEEISDLKSQVKIKKKKFLSLRKAMQAFQLSHLNRDPHVHSYPIPIQVNVSEPSV